MEGADVLAVGRDAIQTMLAMALPVLLVGLAVGLIIAVFQTMTSIQEMTLTFIPKIIAIFLALLTFLPMMGQKLNDFMERIADRIAGG